MLYRKGDRVSVYKKNDKNEDGSDVSDQMFDGSERQKITNIFFADARNASLAGYLKRGAGKTF